MSDICAFLLARIQDDEDRAHAAARRQDPRDDDLYEWPIRDEPASLSRGVVRIFLWLELGRSQWEGCVDPEMAEHMSAWDPARVLNECAAKRQAVHELAQLWESGDCFASASASECGPLRAMAAVYAEHADYQPTWGARI